MDLVILCSQVVEVKILDKVDNNVALSFLGRKTDTVSSKRSALCQVWARLNSANLIDDVEKKIKEHVEEKIFASCSDIYSKLKQDDINIEIAVRLQEGHKWSQIGDFEPK